MQVQCTHMQGQAVPDAVLALGNTPHTRYDVEFGRRYTVYGMILWGHVLHYLILNDQTGRPDWMPAFLFRQVNRRLPSNWSFRHQQDENVPVEAIWGYPELIEPPWEHFTNLVERDRAALEVFEQRRRETDAGEVAD